MASQEDIAAIISVISAAYPNFSPTEKTVEVYWQTLSDIEGDELKAATLHCISESGRKFAPSVGELRGAVGELRTFSNNIPSAYEAWGQVCAYWNGRREPKHALIEKTVECLGGWRTLGMSTDQTADRARFIMAYEQLAERALKEQMLLPEVRGYIETNGGRLMAPMDQVKLLASKMKK